MRYPHQQNDGQNLCKHWGPQSLSLVLHFLPGSIATRELGLKLRTGHEALLLRKLKNWKLKGRTCIRKRGHPDISDMSLRFFFSLILRDLENALIFRAHNIYCFFELCSDCHDASSTAQLGRCHSKPHIALYLKLGEPLQKKTRFSNGIPMHQPTLGNRSPFFDCFPRFFDLLLRWDAGNWRCENGFD